MMIDRDRLLEDVKRQLRYDPTYILAKVTQCIRSEPDVESSPNDPLILEELLEMDREPVYVTSSIGERPMWYIVDVKEYDLKNPWYSIPLNEWGEGHPYSAYRRKPGKELHHE